MSGHLGPLAAALVDDQLHGGDRERALRHVAACASCRFDVEQQRAVKARLDEMNAPMLPGSLLEKLQSMQLLPPGVEPEVGLPEPAAQLPLAVGDGLSGRPPGASAPSAGATTARVSSRSRVRRVLVGATSLVLLGGGAAYATSSSADDGGAPVQPAVDISTVVHSTPSGAAPNGTAPAGTGSAGTGPAGTAPIDPAVSAVTVGLVR